MALSYSAILRYPLAYPDNSISCSSGWEFSLDAFGAGGILGVLGQLKTFNEQYYGGTLSWVVTTDGTYDIYTITWTGLTADPATTPSPYDSVFRGNPVAFLYNDDVSGDAGSFQWVYADLCQDTGNCPQCPPNVNPDDATDCPDCYSDEVPFCDTPISILGLADSTQYTFSIIDQATGRTYTYTATTDANGQADLATADFPTGLFTPYNGPFTITIFDTNGDPVVLTYGYVNYSCVEVTITNSVDYTP